MHRMYRAHGDPFPEIDRPFEEDPDRYSTRYYYPASFDIGMGRLRTINNMLLDMFGDIGDLLNAKAKYKSTRQIDAYHWAYHRAASVAFHRAERKRTRTLLAKALRYAITLICEVIAIGGAYHIPLELRPHVRVPYITPGCLAELVDQLYPEEFPVPAHLPSSNANTAKSELGLFGSPEYLPKNMGKVNYWLSHIYGKLGEILNRADYIDKVSDAEFDGITPKSHRVTLAVHLRNIQVWLDRALLLMNERSEHDAIMFEMPSQLREPVMTILCDNMMYPANDVTCLYQSVINGPLPGGHIRLDQRTRHLNLLVLKLDAGIATLSSRLRACLTVRFPELARLIIRDDLSYARLATYIVERSMLDEKDAALIDIVGYDRVASNIAEAVNASMGAPLTALDIAFVSFSAGLVMNQLECREEHFQDLSRRMMTLAPNLTSLMGSLPAFRLIDWAGSLQSLASLQVGDIKFLGTERLHNRPQHGGMTQERGVLFGHRSFLLVGSSSRKRRKLAAALSQMCHNAVRVDLNLNEPPSSFGECLSVQIGEMVDSLNSEPQEEPDGHASDASYNSDQ